jgi:DNA-binding PadR family transcriptional regulator
VSSIRLFILGALAEEGEMHGHQLRHLAEQERVHLWTDISVGALYGALKRLAVDGLITEVRTEQMGSYPPRQVWGITDDGRIALANERHDGMREVIFRPDPVDLALARQDPRKLGDLPELLHARIATLRTMLDDAERLAHSAAPYVSPLEARVIDHKSARLRAEIAWHESLAEDLPELLAAEAKR